jgi:exosortase A-associated hydrolase 2
MAQRVPAEAFFLPAPDGERYCLYHAPAADVAPRGALVHVHAFGDEMNKCRRMAALQARAFAAAGYAVLQIDLHGCGDSSGDFGAARWDTWHADLALACDWLAQRQPAPVGLWGTRLGALLALDFASRATHPVARVLLWQPVLNGALYMTQFLRIRMAGDMLVEGDAASGAPVAAKSNTTQTMRASLAAGEALEVGGYLLAPELAAAIDGVSLAALGAPGMQVHWFEVMSEAGRALLPAASTAAATLRGRGVDLQVHAVEGPPFWASQEIVEAPQLLAATLTCTEGVAA